MSSDTNGPRLGDAAIFSGQWGNYRYYGLLQIALPALPSDAVIVGSQLMLYTYTSDNVNGGEWTVQTFAPEVDDQFFGLSYLVAEQAPLLGPAAPPLPANELSSAAQATQFTFGPGGVAHLQARLTSTQKVSYRIDGPTNGFSLQRWDSGYGLGGLGPPFKPVLRITYTTAQSYSPGDIDFPLLP